MTESKIYNIREYDVMYENKDGLFVVGMFGDTPATALAQFAKHYPDEFDRSKIIDIHLRYREAVV